MNTKQACVVDFGSLTHIENRYDHPGTSRTPDLVTLFLDRDDAEKWLAIEKRNQQEDHGRDAIQTISLVERTISIHGMRITVYAVVYHRQTPARVEPPIIVRPMAICIDPDCHECADCIAYRARMKAFVRAKRALRYEAKR